MGTRQRLRAGPRDLDALSCFEVGARRRERHRSSGTPRRRRMRPRPAVRSCHQGSAETPSQRPLSHKPKFDLRRLCCRSQEVGASALTSAAQNASTFISCRLGVECRCHRSEALGSYRPGRYITLMSQPLLSALPEKTKLQVARRLSSPSSIRSPRSGFGSPILQLQRALGNRRVAALIQARRLAPGGRIIGIQRKLQRACSACGANKEQLKSEDARISMTPSANTRSLSFNGIRSSMAP